MAECELSTRRRPQRESVPPECGSDLGPHSPNCGEKNLIEKIPRRTAVVVCPTHEPKNGRSIGEEKRRQDGLEDEGRAARAADIERVLAGLSPCRTERKFGRVQRRAIDLGASDACRCPHRRQMLSVKSGLGRLVRMLAMRNGFRVISDNANDERRICPPPSPKLPSISTSMLKDYHRP